MNRVIGGVCLLIGLWQLWMTKRAFTHFKEQGNEQTSPFLLLSFWFSLLFAVILLSSGFWAIFW